MEAYDAAKSVVTLRATTLASVPLDGSFVASEEDRAALFENTLDLAFDQLVDVRFTSFLPFLIAAFLKLTAKRGGSISSPG